MAPGNSLGVYGSSWRLLAEIYENHCFIKQNLYLSLPRAAFNVSHDVYSALLKIHEIHYLIDFWSHGQKVVKSNLLGLVLSTYGTKARKSSKRTSWNWFSRRESHQIEPPGKSSNRASWDSFCRLLEARLENHHIDFPGTGFVDFLSQCKKVIETNLLGLVFSTSGINARKS